MTLTGCQLDTTVELDRGEWAPMAVGLGTLGGAAPEAALKVDLNGKGFFLAVRLRHLAATSANNRNFIMVHCTSVPHALTADLPTW